MVNGKGVSRGQGCQEGEHEVGARCQIGCHMGIEVASSVVILICKKNSRLPKGIICSRAGYGGETRVCETRSVQSHEPPYSGTVKNTPQIVEVKWRRTKVYGVNTESYREVR